MFIIAGEVYEDEEIIGDNIYINNDISTPVGVDYYSDMDNLCMFWEDKMKC